MELPCLYCASNLIEGDRHASNRVHYKLRFVLWIFAILLSYDAAKLNRRDLHSIGGLSLEGLTPPGWLELCAQAASQHEPITGKWVVCVFTHGGPSQVETFDPKMNAPHEIESVNLEIPASLPDVTINSSFPQLAS